MANDTKQETELELLDIVRRMLTAIHTGDQATYSAMCAEDLSCYETDVAPYRIDNLEFHLDLIRSMKELDAYKSLVRFDMLTPRVQMYGESAVVTYTRLMTYSDTESGAHWRAYNETRVFVRVNTVWKMVHFHRSDA